jgi:hypothetical protein
VRRLGALDQLLQVARGHLVGLVDAVEVEQTDVRE